MSYLTASLRPSALPNPLSRVADAIRGLGLVFRALGEGLAAYHRYERLRARGMPHADAAAKSFAT